MAVARLLNARRIAAACFRAGLRFPGKTGPCTSRHMTFWIEPDDRELPGYPLTLASILSIAMSKATPVPIFSSPYLRLSFLSCVIHVHDDNLYVRYQRRSISEIDWVYSYANILDILQLNQSLDLIQTSTHLQAVATPLRSGLKRKANECYL